jgi:cell division protein FtsQ
MAASRSFSVPRARAAALPRRLRPIPRRVLLIAILALAALAGGWMWVRDSSLVSVDRVTVQGAAGPQSAAIRDAVETAARDMTTLHVRIDALRTAVAPYPIVKDVRAQAHFPHGLTVELIQHDPVAQVVVDGRHVPVAGDGTLLRGAVASGIPVLPLRTPPGGDRLTERAAVHAVHLLAAAPAALRAQVAKVFAGPRGLTVRLRQGPTVAFGSGERLTAKWMALSAVLADPSSAGATSFDVRVPERPAAGGLAQIASQQPTGQPPTQTTITTTPAVSGP